MSGGSATCADVTIAMGSRTASVRLSIKLVIATATVTAAATDKTVILRITLSPSANAVAHDQHDQVRLVNIRFSWSKGPSSSSARCEGLLKSPQRHADVADAPAICLPASGRVEV
jgi:hypothetical protein